MASVKLVGQLLMAFGMAALMVSSNVLPSNQVRAFVLGAVEYIIVSWALGCPCVCVCVCVCVGVCSKRKCKCRWLAVSGFG